MLRASELVFEVDGKRILDGVTLEVTPGRLLGILGPNGSGKTTLLRLLAGTSNPTEGRVELDGRDVRGVPRRLLARRLAVVPQETHLAFDYTVLEVVLMGRHPHLGPFELEGPGDLRIAREALRRTGTAGLEARTFTTLSGGEKQRVIIAGALAQVWEATDTGAILLLDEPTASLDLAYQLETAALLTELSREHRVTVVVTTHDLNFAAAICDEVALLCRGRLVSAGPAPDVLNPASIAAVYGVEAAVERHPGSNRLLVVPLSRLSS